MANIRLDTGVVNAGVAENFDSRKAALQADPNCTITHEVVGDNQWFIIYDYTGPPEE